ncbi:lipoprotein [Streptomyces griseoviridis]|uniref:Lipoprotein n=2 Tax=Streptomyces griseoviridis TaxID=45398 RepID=A0A918LEK0_STRGD|nr:lipoprotein [Streptomyces niveoruber]
MVMYRQKQRTIMTVAAAALVPLAAACGGEHAAGGSTSADGEAQEVTGVHWAIDSVTTGGERRQVPQGAHLTLTADGTAEGSYGCNDFHAKASVDGGRVRLSDARSTEIACAGRSADLEKSLARALTAGPLTAKADHGRLTLTTADGDTVRLSERRDAPLHGTTWTVTSPGTAGRAHLAFDRSAGNTATVTGRLGCNRVTARATVGDGHITLGPATTTRMMCEDSLMDAEKRLTGLFDQRIEYRIDQRTLTLTSANGETVRAVAER